MKLDPSYRDFVTQTLSRLPAGLARRLIEFVRDPANVQNIGLWASAVVAGLFAVGFALAFRQVEALARVVFSPEYGAWPWIVSPLAFLGAWALVRWGAPSAGGSGIPQIMAANEINYEGEDRTAVDELLSLRTLVVKVASSLLCVFGGGAIGREGPTLQISASIFHLSAKGVRRLIPHTHEQTWIVAGAAAGLASAFNTPLGGIVYAIEELGAQHFLRVRTALLSAVIVAGVVAQILLGSYLYIGLPTLQDIGLSFLPWALVTGLITGFAGGIFGFVLFALASLRTKFSALGQALVALVCGLSIVVLAHSSKYATGPGIEVMTDLLFKGDVSDWWLVTTRICATMISYLSGAAGGIFAPSLAVGAAMGSVIGHDLSLAHPNLMVLLGMIGFLTGVTRTPFTAFILVLEMTDRHSAIFPMMITALTAQSAARMIDQKGFYEAMKIKFLPVKR